jgi:zinc and cadmium transporter
MLTVWIYSLVSVFIISLIAIVGLVTFSIKVDTLKKILVFLISFSAGALFGDAFLHLLPEISETGIATSVSVSIILGILLFFLLEKVIHWRHCHMPITKTHVHPFAYMNLLGDALHNFLDGIIIASSYIVSIPAGIATTIAVLLHEIPQEIGDFGVLVYAGFSKKKAVIMNFLTALSAVLGVIVALLAYNLFVGIEIYLVGLAIGGFLYIAGSDLIPELHKETKVSISLIQIITFILGVLVMASLLLLE